jgi:hypothetical protein
MDNNVVNYSITLESEGDDLIFNFPDELIESLNWKVGDTIIWNKNEDGSWTMRKGYDNE